MLNLRKIFEERIMECQEALSMLDEIKPVGKTYRDTTSSLCPTKQCVAYDYCQGDKVGISPSNHSEREIWVKYYLSCPCFTEPPQQ
jgi:hypothetical protein